MNKLSKGRFKRPFCVLGVNRFANAGFTDDGKELILSCEKDFVWRIDAIGEGIFSP